MFKLVTTVRGGAVNAAAASARYVSRRPEARCDAREPGSDVLPASVWEFAEGGQFVPLAERYQHIANFQMQQRVPWSFGVDADNLTLP